jgi:innexin
MVPREVAEAVSRKTDLGDWWIIYMLGRNLDPIIFKDVLSELVKRIDPSSKRDNKK